MRARVYLCLVCSHPSGNLWGLGCEVAQADNTLLRGCGWEGELPKGTPLAGRAASEVSAPLGAAHCKQLCEGVAKTFTK